MISSAFKGAYQNHVKQQTQGINTITGGIKDAGTAVLGILGFSGALGNGVIAEAGKNALANRIGGVGGNIMLATLEEKKQTALQAKSIYDIEDTYAVDTAFDTAFASNLQNAKAFTTVWEKLTKKREQKAVESAEQEIMKNLYNEPEVAKGYTRLYRGLENEYDPNYKGKRDNPEGYESWTNNRELAKQYGKNVYYMDFKNSDIADSYLDENPNSETYGDRNYIYKNTGKEVGLNNISGDEYLLYTQHDKHENAKYNKIGGNK